MRSLEPSPHADDRAGWEHFPHGADIGVRGWGATLAQAFEEAAVALTHIVTDSDIQPLREVIVSCHAPDAELLLVEWLNAVIYEMAVGHMLFARFAVAIDDDLHLYGSLWGEPVDIARHAPAVEPKGATCTALHVVQEHDGHWTAGCVVDV